MGNVEIIQCEGWADFKVRYLDCIDWTGADQKNPGDFLYRGVKNADYDLVSSFTRRLGQRSVVATDLLTLFREACAADKDVFPIIENELEITALAQHHGLPTLTLDWSESPYVAAYFAYFSAIIEFTETTNDSLDATDRQVAIWVIDKSRADVWEIIQNENIGTQHTGKFPKVPDEKILIFDASKMHNGRLHNQMGWLTYHCKTKTDLPRDPLNHFVENLHEGENPIIWKFEIPLKDALTGMHDLMVMGIHASRLFPGRDGYGQVAMERLGLRLSQI